MTSSFSVHCHCLAIIATVTTNEVDQEDTMGKTS